MQQANISVSTLKCDPYDDSVTLDDLNSELEKLKSTPDRLDDIDSKLEKLRNTQAGTPPIYLNWIFFPV